jgi:hypothetical protein
VHGLDAEFFAQTLQQEARPGVEVTDCDAVALQRCTITGGLGATSHQFSAVVSSGASALQVTDSRVSLAGCTLLGGSGGDDDQVGGTLSTDEGGNGGHGMELYGSTWVMLSGNVVQGGHGGDGCDDPAQFLLRCLAGAGIVAEAGVVLQDLDNAFAGGEGGLVVGVGPQPDAPALALHRSTVHTVFPGQAVETSKIAPLRTGETGTFTVTGPPGTLFALFIAFEPGYLPLGWTCS